MVAEPKSPRRRFRLTFSQRVPLTIALVLSLSGLVYTAVAVNAVTSSLTDQSEQEVSNVNAAISALVQTEYNDIVSYRTQTLESRKQSLQDIAAPIVASLDEFAAAAQSGELTTAQAQARSLDMVKSMRFGNDDYFFVYDLDLNAIGHPDDRIQGRNLTDMQDADGRYLLREARELVLTQGSGYLDYRWERLEGAVPSPKIGYLFLYEPWDWLVGTGVYVDDVDAEVQKRLTAVESELQQTFADLSFAGDGFFLILDRTGDVVASGSPAVSAAAQTAAGQEAIASILAAAPTEAGVELTATIQAPWNPDGDGAWRIQTSTTGGDLDWILVSAVNQEKLAAPARALAIQMALIAVLVVLVGLIIGVLLSRRITKPVDAVARAATSLADGTFDPTTLDSAARRTDELGDLARTFRTMGIEIAARERRLREQVQQLSVQIDRTKVAAEVQEITESDYFQRLKSRSRELRDRDD
jgi:two-component system, cell cycle sensor histidine kinase and response regulator CckA